MSQENNTFLVKVKCLDNDLENKMNLKKIQIVIHIYVDQIQLRQKYYTP